MAGYESISATISGACFYLAKYPELQKKLYQEIVTKIEELQTESTETNLIKLITFDSMARFEYLNAVINETLRLMTPATNVERTAKQDVKLESIDGKYKIQIKKDDTIHIPLYALHRDPLHFPEPELFKPERFIGTPTFHNYAYLPFGSGPRNCVAKSLGLLETKLVLLHLIRCFEMKLGAKCKGSLDFYVQNATLSPKEVWLKVEARL